MREKEGHGGPSAAHTQRENFSFAFLCPIEVDGQLLKYIQA